MQARTEPIRARKPLVHDGSNPQTQQADRSTHPKEVVSHRKTKTMARISEIAQQCADLAERVKEQQRLERVEAISEWCSDIAVRLAEDRFGTGEEPDDMDDVVSVAWEINELSDGKWPPSTVIRMARRRVNDGRHFEVSTVTIESAEAGHTEFEMASEFVAAVMPSFGGLENTHDRLSEDDERLRQMESLRSRRASSDVCRT